MRLYRWNQAVVLDLSEEPRRDILLSLEIAEFAANELDRIAQEILALGDCGASYGNSAGCEAVENRGVGQVRLTLGRWERFVLLDPRQAISLAEGLRQMARYADRYIRDNVERNPKILLT